MYKKLVSLCVSLCAFTGAFAQSAPAANPASKLLVDAYRTISAQQKFSISFEYKLSNAKEHINQVSDGKIHFQGEKYHLYLDGFMERIFDGKFVYTILSEEQEVNIDKPSDAEQNLASFKDMLRIFQTNYHAKMDVKKNEGGKSIQFIRLDPKQSKSGAYVLVGVDTKTKFIAEVMDVDTSGSTMSLRVKKFDMAPASLSGNEFIFERKKYQDAGFYISNP